MNCDATINGRHINSDAVTTDRNAWPNILDDIAHEDLNAGRIKSQIHTTPARSDFYVTMISGKELRLLIQVEVQSVIKTAQSEKMKNVSRNLA